MAPPIAVGAGVVAAGLLTVLGYAMREPLRAVGRTATRGSARMGKGLVAAGSTAASRLNRAIDLDALLVRAGVRRRSLLLRALPAVGIAAGLLALGAASLFLAPTLRARLPQRAGAGRVTRAPEATSEPVITDSGNGGEANFHAH